MGSKFWWNSFFTIGFVHCHRPNQLHSKCIFLDEVRVMLKMWNIECKLFQWHFSQTNRFWATNMFPSRSSLVILIRLWARWPVLQLRTAHFTNVVYNAWMWFAGNCFGCGGACWNEHVREQMALYSLFIVSKFGRSNVFWNVGNLEMTLLCLMEIVGWNKY